MWLNHGEPDGGHLGILFLDLPELGKIMRIKSVLSSLGLREEHSWKNFALFLHKRK